MFEAAELGRKLDKDEYKTSDEALRIGLLETQRKLKSAGIATVVLVSGVEGAGKSVVINRFNRWFDSRSVRTCSYWSETEDEIRRPPYWRFWRDLPPRGDIAVMFGSWYSKPIVNKVFGTIDASAFEQKLRQATEFEKMLVDDGLLLIKLWFHLPQEVLASRVARGRDNTTHLPESPLMESYLPHYAAFRREAEHALRMTDHAHAHWHIIEATDENYRDIRAGQLVMEAMQDRLSRPDQQDLADKSESHGTVLLGKPGEMGVLDAVDLDSKAGDQAKKELATWQSRLYELSWQASHARKSLVVVFEGWDAAGKGSAIRRVTRAIDARLHKVISIGAPSDEENARHYLWRFWRHIPLSGFATLYDRSWYGRVLVERVEQFASPVEWQRAYHEINHYEEQLVSSGITLCKFWIHIDRDEQLKRFREREVTPWKNHKITDEDWRNRDKWDEYRQAVNDMVTHTSTEYAPWHLIAGNDKKFARIQVVKTLCQALEKVLAESPDHKDGGGR